MHSTARGLRLATALRSCSPAFSPLTSSHQATIFPFGSRSYVSEDLFKKYGGKAPTLTKKFKLEEKLAQKEKKTDKPTEYTAFIPEDVRQEKARMEAYKFQEEIRFEQEDEELTEAADYEEEMRIAKEETGDNNAEGKIEPIVTPVERKRLVDENGRAYGLGGRKRSVARVWIEPGEGTFKVNDRAFVEYFESALSREHVLEPLFVTEQLGRLNITALVRGGGYSGQAGAIRHGIARALQNWDPELRPALKKAGCLERDQREVERKKPGQAKARKKYQWSKR